MKLTVGFTKIGEKYRKWEANNPKYNTQSRFFPEGPQTYFSNIFFKNKKIVRSNKCKKKKLFVENDWQYFYLIPLKKFSKIQWKSKILK